MRSPLIDNATAELLRRIALLSRSPEFLAQISAFTVAMEAVFTRFRSLFLQRLLATYLEQVVAELDKQIHEV